MRAVDVGKWWLTFTCASQYAREVQRWTLQQRVSAMRFRLSDESLSMLPEFRCRRTVLQQLGYIDVHGNVTLKGRVACEMNTCDDGASLVATELIFENALADMQPAEIVGLLSALVFQERVDTSQTKLPSQLEKACAHMVDLARRVAQVQYACGLPVSEAEFPQEILKFGLVEVVYEWGKGMPFRHIMDLTDVLEGSIVRCITRLVEVLRDVRSAAIVVGDPELVLKMDAASHAIKRDIVFAASLYLT
jgi:antiviral helicase SKI2